MKIQDEVHEVDEVQNEVQNEVQVQEVLINEEQFEEFIDISEEVKVYCKWNLGILSATLALLVVIIISIFVSQIK